MRKYKFNLGLIITIIAVFASLYHMISTQWLVLSLDEHKVLHITFGLVIVYLLSLQKVEGKAILFKKILRAVLLVAAIAASAFILINYESISTNIGLPSTSDTIVGFILVVIVLEATRRAWGFIIPSIVLVAMLYGYFGQYMPGILYHSGLSFERLIAYASTNFQGIYGSFTGIGAREVFMFVLLGTTLQAAGATNFFMKIAQGVGGRFRSGPAQAAVISSAFMGSVSGNISTNVATTGSITIPMMHKKGLSREYAGAVEAVASTGGQIMPPVMGAAAFLMATNLGVSYAEILIAALLPALTYYLYLAVSIQIRAVKVNLSMKTDEKVNTLQALKEDGYLMISLIVLILALYVRVPVTLAALYAILSLFILVGIKKFIVHKNVKVFLKEMGAFLVESLKSGAINGTKLGLMMASLGIMIELFVVTGFAQRMSFQMIDLAGGYLPLLLILVAITCLIFGLGMPTTGAYLTVALLAAPAMINFGVPAMVAHFYVFYFALMAAVTPPVGIGAIVATGISGGNYLKTALHATKLALPGFLLPIFFVYRPDLLFVDANLFEAVFAFVSTLTGLIAISALIEWYFVDKLKIWQALLLLISSALLLMPEVITSVAGLVLFGAVIFIQYKLKQSSVGLSTINQSG
ncbi:TRAP transporter fused permease subunit [Virgibacillus sp. YIM 98842]|uniref:TRAP transporter permease n=1 Tax=Virgibacillus sp. YIM 98842 TaxID=2663533 RepID=UPI0013DD2E85|nr:TRAP transporter fused permease subunit [Virgibacillus sp. YIM 98842]